MTLGPGHDIPGRWEMHPRIQWLGVLRKRKAGQSLTISQFGRLETSNGVSEILAPENLRSRSFGVRSGSARGPFGIRSGSVRGPRGVRSGSVRGSRGVGSGSVRDPFEGRTGFVRSPFGLRSGSVRDPFGVRLRSVCARNGKI